MYILQGPFGVHKGRGKEPPPNKSVWGFMSINVGLCGTTIVPRRDYALGTSQAASVFNEYRQARVAYHSEDALQ